MRVLPLLIVLGITISCERFHDYEYMVKNGTESILEIEVRSQSLTLGADSTYIADSNQDLIIVKLSDGPSGAREPEMKDVTAHLDFIRVIRLQDSIESSTNYLETNSWSFQDGIYKALISDDDFD